jgi:hypothetical protein
MRQGKLLVALAALPMIFGGCDALDVLKADSLDPPDIDLQGQIAFNGQPVPVRAPSGTAQLLVYHTSWVKENGDSLPPSSMNVHLNTDGTFSGKLYPGTYDIRLIDGQGPWVNDTTHIAFTAGAGPVNVPVKPYYTIVDDPNVADDLTFKFNKPAAGDTTGGSITATFKVGQHVTAPALELVGLYINVTPFVDRSKRETTLRVQTNPAPPAGQIAASPHERVRTQVQTQLTNNQAISITLVLPSNIRVTRSPELRNTLYARVGVKAAAVAELAYSKVVPVSIVP